MDKYIRAYLKQPCLFDYQYKEIKDVSGTHHNEHVNYIPNHNAIVYTSINNFKELSNHLYGRKCKYVILIESYDHSLPYWHFSRSIKQVYSTNVSVIHPRYKFFPFGILSRHYNGIKNAVHSAHRESKILVAFNVGTYDQRKLYLENISKNKLSDVRNFPMDYNEYFDTLTRYKFCAAPRGNGIDTYRMYESLHLGCIPIVLPNLVNKLSPFQKIFTNTKFWISEENIYKQYSNIKYMDNELLHCQYWYNQMKQWLN